MKASEYVKFLQEMIDEYGDRELFTEYDRNYYGESPTVDYSDFGYEVGAATIYRHEHFKMSGTYDQYDNDPDKGEPMEVFVVA
jgi:hypothetical protein